MRKVVVAAVVASVWVCPAFASGAAYEPNDSRSEATPLTGGRTYAGAIETSNDEDWFAFYTASRTQLDVALTNSTTWDNGTSGCTNVVGKLVDGNGEELDSTRPDPGTTGHILYSTPISAQRYYVRVYDIFGADFPPPTGTCAWQLQVSPSEGLVSGACYRASYNTDRLERAVRATRRSLARATRLTTRIRLRRLLQRQLAQLATARRAEDVACP